MPIKDPHSKMAKHFDSLVQLLLEKHHLKNGNGDSSLPLVVGIAGGVSVGKSTFAKHLQELIQNCGLSAAVVSADSFLMSNDVLKEKELMNRKGFPESFYEDHIREFLLRLQRQNIEKDRLLSIPIYDHLCYDIRAGESQEVPNTNIVLFEGINVLRFHDYLDLSIYLEAKEEDMYNWFINRWINFRKEIAKREPIEFFKPYQGMSDEEFVRVLGGFWNNINVPNLRENIEPTKQFANAIVRKAADHSLVDIIRQG